MGGFDKIKIENHPTNYWMLLVITGKEKIQGFQFINVTLSKQAHRMIHKKYIHIIYII